MKPTIFSIGNFPKIFISLFRDAEFRGLLLLVILLVIGGVLVYSYVESWNVVDSFYFSVSTLTTTGFGDVVPQTSIGKIFTALYMIIGIGLMLAFIRKIAESTMKKGSKK
jgi:hypothetical protein